MGFEVNGVPYVLTFDREHERWQLLATAGGDVTPLAIYDDCAPAAGAGQLLAA
jgi:hypothetical protein